MYKENEEQIILHSQNKIQSRNREIVENEANSIYLTQGH